MTTTDQRGETDECMPGGLLQALRRGARLGLLPLRRLTSTDPAHEAAPASDESAGHGALVTDLNKAGGNPHAV